MTDTVTHADGGVAFSTGLPGIAGLSWDGTALWVLPYVNLDANIPSSQNVYSYSPSGSLLKTVRLTPPVFPNPSAPRDGFVVTPTGFVTDRGASVPYDLFDLSGNLVTPYFIISPLRSTGVAFDGQQFIVSDVVTQQISMYGLNGLFLSTTSLSGAVIPFGLEGLSVVASTTPPVPPAPTPVALATLSFSPATATGGGLPVVGMVTLSGPAPAGNAIVTISSGNQALASVPGGMVTMAAGVRSATFPVTTTAVAAATTVTLSAAYNGATVSANLVLIPSFRLASVTLNPTTLAGGSFGVGTVTLTSPSDGSALITLSSSNPLLARVSGSVLVPAGVSSVGFTVGAQAGSGTAIISASLGGVTQSATLTVTAGPPPPPAPPSDTVTVTRAEYAVNAQQLKIEATSSSSQATLTVSVTSTSQVIGTLSNAGGGKYNGQFIVPVNPRNITVKSSGGGTATLSVTAK